MKQKHTEYEQQMQEQAESISPELLNEKIADASRTIFSYCILKVG